MTFLHKADVSGTSPTNLVRCSTSNTTLAAVAAATLAATLAGCASMPPPKAPTVPAALQVPVGAVLYLEALATGVQIYECTRRPDGAFEWTFRFPEAPLTDRAGKNIGKHYAGPTWEGLDGSKVVGEVRARDPGPVPGAIPWLLLGVKSTSGAGTFDTTRFIHRTATVGGVAPAGGCGEGTLGTQSRVPYKAEYFYYR